jgi:YVTN family beta-propeller protein
VPRRAAAATLMTVAALALAGPASAAPRARPLAYVPKDDGGVSVLNTASGTVVATVPVPGYPQGVAVTPNGAFAYVPSEAYGATGRGAVSVINTVTNGVVASVPVDTNPSSVAITPNGRYAYVTNRSGNAPLSSNPIVPADGAFFSSVSVISTATRRVVAKVGIGYEPVDVALSPNGAFAYVINEGSALETFDVINAKTNKVVAAFNGKLLNPSDVTVSPDGRSVLIADAHGLTVVDASTHAVAGTVAVPYHFGSAVAVAPSGRYAYVTSGPPGGGSDVEVVDLSARAVVATIPVGDDPSSLTALAFSPDGRSAYATDTAGDVAVIDTATNTVTSTVPLGGNPDAIAVQPAPPCGKTIYELLECGLPKLKTYVSCGAEILTFGELKGLKLIKALPKAYKLRDVHKALRPLAELYNRFLEMRFGRRTGARVWRDLRNSKTVGELVSKAVEYIAADVDLHDNDVEAFLRDLAKFAGVDDCVNAVLGEKAPQ